MIGRNGSRESLQTAVQAPWVWTYPMRKTQLSWFYLHGRENDIQVQLFLENTRLPPVFFLDFNITPVMIYLFHIGVIWEKILNPLVSTVLNKLHFLT